MTTTGDVTAQGTATGTARAPVEPRRAANLAGLLVVDAALAARGAVLGVLVTLVVSSRAPGPVAVTFALTAHQLVVWIAYPWLGRASDRSGTSLGRRTPYLAGGLLVAGAGQMLIPHTGDYWPLVAVLVAVHLGLGTYRAARPAALPESFGRSRWLKALLVTGLVSLVSAAGMRGVAIVTWTDDDPGTWAPAFLTSGGLCVLAGLAVLVLVRQPTRTARPGPEPGAGSRERHHWRRLVAHARAQP
ncbi:MAG: MFS transporter, partial [Acidimicrobiales bacterium]